MFCWWKIAKRQIVTNCPEQLFIFWGVAFFLQQDSNINININIRRAFGPVACKITSFLAVLFYPPTPQTAFGLRRLLPCSPAEDRNGLFFPLFPLLVALLGLLTFTLAIFPLNSSIFIDFSSIFIDFWYQNPSQNLSKKSIKKWSNLPSNFVIKLFWRALSIKSGILISTEKTHIKINIFINQW